MENKKFIEEFIRVVKDDFQSFLKSYGFNIELNEIQADFSQLVFCKDNQYIKIIVNLNPRDIPHYWNIILGEGEAFFPEADWNSIALWRVMKFQGKKEVGEYILNNLVVSKIPQIVRKGRIDLNAFGESFLNGNLELFYKIRSELNKSREPYKVYSPSKKGKYKQLYDSDSEKMKKKFS